MITRKKVLIIALTAGVICLLVYLRSLGCGFVNWDDQDFVINNQDIRALNWHLIAWAFGSMPPDLWTPLSYVSFAIDYHFWGLNPFGYHLTNVLLHSISTAFVVLIADGFCREKYAVVWSESGRNYLYPGMLLIAGLLFGIHPLRVESVAWVAERKDVLSIFFCLAAILSYLNYVQKRESGVKGTSDYVATLILFVLALMSKPISVVLPAMLLVVDWYPLERFRKGRVVSLLLEKLPFFFLSVLLSIGTVAILIHLGSVRPTGEISFAQRLVIAGNGVFEYMRLTVWPIGVLPIHIITDPIPSSFVVKSVITLLLCCYILSAGRKRPWIAMTWLCFIIPLFPVLGLLQNGLQAFAARFTYLPSVALSIVAAVLTIEGYRKSLRSRRSFVRVLFAGTLVSVFAFYVVMTQRYIDVWKDSGTLWSRQIAYQPFDKALFWRGLFYTDSGMYDAAIDDYTVCLHLAVRQGSPEIYNLYAFRGEAFAKSGRYDQAVRDFTVAINDNPHPLFFYHRSLALAGLGRAKEADDDARKAGGVKGQIMWISRAQP